MKLAIVHDQLAQAGGEERVIKCLHEIYPDAPIFTSFYIKEDMPDAFRSMDIRTTFMQKLPGIRKHYKKYSFLYAIAMASIDLKGYEMVLSSSRTLRKGLRKPTNACHICYCKWELRKNKDVDYFIANSDTTAQRIKSLCNRDSVVIHPPVDTSLFKPYNSKINVEDYCLVVSRLDRNKRIDIAVSAFNKLGFSLYVIGTGTDENRLKRIAGPNIRFLGYVADNELVKYYSMCKAFILTGTGDFGLTPVEVQSCGRPVIAYKGGGALESVVEGSTGLFFDELSEKSLIDAVKRLERTRFDPNIIRRNALRFDKEEFKVKIRDFVEQKYREFTGK